MAEPCDTPTSKNYLHTYESMQPYADTHADMIDPHNLVLQLPWCRTCGPAIQALFHHARVDANTQALAQHVPRSGSPMVTARSLSFHGSTHHDQLHKATTASVSEASTASHGYHQRGVRTTAPSVIARLVSGTTTQAQAVAAPVPTTASRNGRGVRVACTNCRSANKRCDDARPCPRCIKGGLRESCANAPPKPRRRRPVAAALAGGPDIGVTSDASQAAFPAGEPTGAPDLDIACSTYPPQYHGGELAGLPSLPAGSAPPGPVNCSDDRAFTPYMGVAADDPSIAGQSCSCLAAHGACLGWAPPAANLPSWLASAPQWAGPSTDSSYFDFWGNNGASHAGMGSGETGPRSGCV